MFKKFAPKEDVASNTVLKSSSQRAIRTKLVSQYPLLSRPAAPSPEDAPATVATPAKKGKKGTKGQPDEAEDDGDQTVTVLDRIWPRKEPLFLVKCRDHVSVLTLHGLPLFFQSFDGPYFPTLKLLHQYPELLPPVRVDRGAIKFVLSGANIMCPGLTSPGARLPSPTPDIPSADTPVAVLAEGKEEACAVGLLKMASEEMRKVNKGIGVENVHWLGDDLWVLDKI